VHKNTYKECNNVCRVYVCACVYVCVCVCVCIFGRVGFARVGNIRWAFLAKPASGRHCDRENRPGKILRTPFVRHPNDRPPRRGLFAVFGYWIPRTYLFHEIADIRFVRTRCLGFRDLCAMVGIYGAT